MSMPKSPSPDHRRRPALLHTQIRSKPRRHLTTSMSGIRTPRIQARAMVSKNHNPSLRLISSHLGNLRVEPNQIRLMGLVMVIRGPAKDIPEINHTALNSEVLLRGDAREERATEDSQVACEIVSGLVEEYELAHCG